MKLYDELAEWWPLLSSPQDYAEEADHHWAVMTRHARRKIETVLELGCGGGNNAVHLKRRCRMTLTDQSPQMIAVARTLNPECEFAVGDMRDLRLGRKFDAVFVHDAVMYLQAEADLRAAMATARAHCNPGGVALLVPDCTKESWAPSTSHGGDDAGDRGLRYLSWSYDLDPGDTTYHVEMTYLLRNGDRVRAETERHVYGLFPRETWLRLLEEIGFEARSERCSYAGGEAVVAFVGVC